MKKILILLLLLSCTFDPEILKINLYGEFGSSGGDRYYSVNLTFKGDELIEGHSRYDYGSGSDGKLYISECTYINNTWTGRACSMSIEQNNQTTTIPDTRANIEKRIQTGEFKPANKCQHGAICYRKL